ncbi:hypothetical protein D3C81_1519260 [compost metagenome]
MDGVVVAADPGVLPSGFLAGIPAPGFDQRQFCVVYFCRRLAGHLGAPAKHGAGFFPQCTHAIVEPGDQIEGSALGMRLQVLHMHADIYAAEAAQWAYHMNAIVQVHQAQQREGECLVGE